MKLHRTIILNKSLPKLISFLLPLIIITMPSHGYAQAIELKTAAQESAPKYFKNEKSEIVGLCIDIIREIEQTDPEIIFSGHNQFLPFNRLQKQLEDGELDVFLGFKKTPARMEKYHFVEIPLYQLDYKFAMLTDSDPSTFQIENMKDIGPEVRVLSVKGAAAANFLRAQEPDFIIDDSASSPSKMIWMLKNGRAHLAFYHDLGLYFVINRMDEEQNIQVSTTSYSNYSHYLAFSRKVPQETVNKVTIALQKLREEGSLERIAQRYKSLYHDQLLDNH